MVAVLPCSLAQDSFKGRKGKEMKEKERKGKEREGKGREGKEREGKERKGRKGCGLAMLLQNEQRWPPRAVEMG